jgi:heavy metal-binding protein
MNFFRFLTALLFAAALLLTSSPVYSVTAGKAVQKERSAHSKKPTKFHYVCPMHEKVTSKKPGSCPKCKMELVKKPIPQEPAQ